MLELEYAQRTYIQVFLILHGSLENFIESAQKTRETGEKKKKTGGGKKKRFEERTGPVQKIFIKQQKKTETQVKRGISGVARWKKKKRNQSQNQNTVRMYDKYAQRHDAPVLYLKMSILEK